MIEYRVRGVGARWKSVGLDMAEISRRDRLKVAHLTSVHAVSDPRIFHKECATLAAHGYEVILIAQHDRDETVHGVRIRAVPRASSRLARMTMTVWNVYRAAIDEDCDVYHFHDPELIPIAIMLRLRGKPVIYDIHEDYRTSIQQKEYIPHPLRNVVAAIAGRFEVLASTAFEQVLAERYYQKRFPSGRLVLNYPLESRISGHVPVDSARSEQIIRLLYTGGISVDRGALAHAALVRLDESVEVHMIGRCSPALATRLRSVAGDAGSRLFITGEGCHVPYERILGAYRAGGWTAGLALFPLTQHYREKELTKFFEYMAAGIPVLCSNFPVWRSLIEKAGCGLTVDPEKSADILTAIAVLAGDRERASGMARRGRDAVADGYNWSTQAEELLSLYESLVKQRTADRHRASRSRTRPE